MDRRRMIELQMILSRHRVDLAVLGPLANMRYLLGDAPLADERPCMLFIESSGGGERNGQESRKTPLKMRMVVPSLNADKVYAIPGIDSLDIDIRTWDDAEGPSACIESALSRIKARRIAVDGSMRADFLIPVLSILGPKEIVSADPLVSELRIKKSPEEVEALQKAANQADRAMARAIEACVPGASEQQVAWAAEQAFRLDGAEKVEFTLVAAGPNAAFPHHNSGKTRFEQGMGVIIDIGASLGGYKSDITRTVFLGEPPEDFVRAYDAVLGANECARNTVTRGVTADSVDRAARTVLEGAGLGEYFIHRTGHGIGLDVHEAPWIMKGNDMKLEPGMVFSIEPGVYLPGKYGIRIEDIIVVTENGARLLTGYDHRLITRG